MMVSDFTDFNVGVGDKESRLVDLVLNCQLRMPIVEISSVALAQTSN